MSRISGGSRVNVSSITLSTHTGTHIDPPVHFIPGAKAVDQLDLETLICPALVVDMRERSAITADDLEMTVPAGVERLLLKTDNSSLWEGKREFTPDYVALTDEAAQWLVEQEVRLVGIDYLSVQSYDEPHSGTHTTLLGAGVIIVEGLNLLEVQPGLYRLVCLPLNIAQGDGAPARAVLIG
ncbi:MAG: cyclase family protein [Chloroflexota bacterium]|nr:cyclase family protein [Chloroflexota bacterium]